MPPKASSADEPQAFPAGIQRGDVVFAKIFGFPWWPSVVRSVRHAANEAKPEIRVRFCHTNDNAPLPPKSLAIWAEHPEWQDLKGMPKFKSPALKKKWEAALAEAKAHTVDPEATWSDDEEAALEEQHAKMESSWLTQGHDWLGRRVARPFGKTKVFLGTIMKWIPPDEEAGDGPLFHVVHDDGDEEDLEDFEVTAAFKCYAEQPEAKRAQAVEAKAAAAEAKAVRQAAKAAMAAVQGPRSALLFFKLECESALGEAADPEMEVEEVSQLLRDSYDELSEGDKAWYEQRAAKDVKRWEREKKRKKSELAAGGGDENGGGNQQPEAKRQATDKPAPTPEPEPEPDAETAEAAQPEPPAAEPAAQCV